MNEEKKIKIFILAGGFGTRLSNVLDKDTPKPMAEINGRPFLEYKISEIRKYFPLNNIYLLTHHLSDSIESYFKDYSNIVCIKEDKPLGTGGSIKNAIQSLDLDDSDRLLVFNGDTYLKPDLDMLIAETSNGISMVACYCKNTIRFNTLKILDDNIIKFLDKKSNDSTNFINGGCYFFDNLIYLKSITKQIFSIEEMFKEYVTSSPIKALIYNDIFIDIGVPEDYTKIQKLKLNE